VGVLQIKILKTAEDLAGPFKLETQRIKLNSSNTKNNNNNNNNNNGPLTTFGSRKK
jgi:hypothetical protein